MFAMSEQPRELPNADRAWRVWASVAVVAILFLGIVLGVLIIPIIQGRGAALDAYTAICRSLGILPGSPAQRQPSTAAPATPVSQVIWTPEVLQVLARADTSKGRVAVQEVCFACHGENGIAVSADYPNLNGQSGAAIYKQLSDYRTGSRQHEQMSVIAQGIDDAVLPDLAAYYAGQPKRRPALVGAPKAILQLIELGDPSRNIPPCRACHRAGAGGPIETPTLNEQVHDYFVRQLQAFASGQRRNDVYGRMRLLAAQLSPAEMDGLARYYAAGQE
jgi:cytochrome c553